MDNASAALQFDITPCPVCGMEFTTKDVKPDGAGGLVLRHDCSQGDKPSYIVHGENLRMVVQNWNRILWRYGQ